MEVVIALALTFGLLWVVFVLPQQRRARAHQQLVADLQVDDEVVMTAGIYGRITSLGPEHLQLEVAPGVEMRVARQAVLRRIESALPDPDPDSEPEPADEIDEPTDETEATEDD